MRAAILAIGDELTRGETTDTNSPWLAARLGEMGIVTVEHRTVEDDREAIREAVASLIHRADVLLMTGGLGPTNDDLTREALGDVFNPGRDLVRDEDALRWLQERYANRTGTMPQSNLVQTLRPASMRCMHNPNGTAPGLAGVGMPPEFRRRCHVFALPGPPSEMKPMFVDHVIPALRAGMEGLDAGTVALSAQVHSFGIGESRAAELLEGMMARDRAGNGLPVIGTTVSGGIVSARIRARGQASVVKPLIDADVQEVERRWSPYAYGRDGVTLANATHVLLRQFRKTVATAESCTGGLLGKLLVDPDGASSAYVGGWITYSNPMKIEELAVPQETIALHGAVSAEVAAAMALGALANAGADYALAITGIAGPDGGTLEKPVGTVFIALASAANGIREYDVRRFAFTGDRDSVRLRSALAAIQILRFALLRAPSQTPLLWEVPVGEGSIDQPAHAVRQS